MCLLRNYSHSLCVWEVEVKLVQCFNSATHKNFKHIWFSCYSCWSGAGQKVLLASCYPLYTTWWHRIKLKLGLIPKIVAQVKNQLKIGQKSHSVCSVVDRLSLNKKRCSTNVVPNWDCGKTERALNEDLRFQNTVQGKQRCFQCQPKMVLNSH